MNESGQEISEILKKINRKDLIQELQIADDEVISYIDNLINTIKKEISPGIFVIPYTGKEILQSFIQEYNIKILVRWLKGKKRRYTESEDI